MILGRRYWDFDFRKQEKMSLQSHSMLYDKSVNQQIINFTDCKANLRLQVLKVRLNTIDCSDLTKRPARAGKEVL